MRTKLLTVFLALCALYAQAQTMVKGTVTGEDGLPLPGVTIQVKGTKIGTSSEANGKFSINAPPNGTLIFSFIGYQQKEIPIGGKTLLDVKLTTDQQALGEVIVVGYGTQKKTTLTGSVAAVQGKELIKSPQPNITNSLVGRTPGLIANNRSGEPGYDGSTLLIRGRATTGDASPLIVIDGVANRPGSFDRLDPNDIESISILKDASAAIYGAQSANGVILITTKRGKTGKPTVSYTYNQGFAMPTRIPKMADAATFATMLNEMAYYQNPSNPKYRYTLDEIQKFRDGSDPLNYPNTDWPRAVLKPVSLQNQHSLSLSGGSETVRYYVSAGSLFQDGFYRKGATNFREYNVRANLDADVSKRLRISADFAFRQENRNFPQESAGSIFRFTLRTYPTLPAYYPNGLPDAGIEQGRNPVVQVTNATGYTRDRRSIVSGTFKARYDLSGLLQGLSVDGFAAIDKEYRFVKNFQKRWKVYRYNKQTNNYDVVYGGPPAPQLSETYYQSNSATYNFRVNYNRTFGVHKLDAFLAYEQNVFASDNLYGFRKNFISDQIDQLFAGDEKDMQSNGSGYENARKNYFGRLNYSYKEKYLAEFQFRYDGSAIFPKDRRYGFFPGILLGWRVTEEDWFKNKVSFINNLKLRASFGELGNDKVPQFQYIQLYNFDGGYVLGQTPDIVKGISVGVVPNPNITWEVAKKYNVGIDASFWNNSLDLTVDVFKERRSNILRPRNASVPAFTGQSRPDENIGIVENKGVEISLVHNRKWREVNFQIGGNFTFVRNRVIFVDEVPNPIKYQMATGRPLDAGLYYKAIGIFQDSAQLNKYPHLLNARPGDLIFEDVNGDGKIDASDRIRVNRNQYPEIIYGLTMGASWRNFDFSMLWQGQAHSVQYILLESGSTGNFFAEDAANRWRPGAPSNKFPRVDDKMYTSINGANPNTFWLKNTDFIRLKNLEIGYNLPAKLLSRFRINSLRIYANGFNLLTFDKLKYINLDPEGNSNTGVFYPQQKIYNVGLNLKF